MLERTTERNIKHTVVIECFEHIEHIDQYEFTSSTDQPDRNLRAYSESPRGQLSRLSNVWGQHLTHTEGDTSQEDNANWYEVSEHSKIYV